MLFKPVLAEKIIWGEKQQTRRRLEVLDTWHHGDDFASVYRRDKNGRYNTLYQIGKEYPVQINYRVKAVGRIRITDIRRTFWDAISDEDAVAEGFKNAQGFIDYVTAMYAGRKPAFDITAPCWALTFEFIPAPHTYELPQFWRPHAESIEVKWDGNMRIASWLLSAGPKTQNGIADKVRWVAPRDFEWHSEAIAAAQACKNQLCELV